MKANRQPHRLNALRRHAQHRQPLRVLLVVLLLLLAGGMLAEAQNPHAPGGAAYLPLAAAPGPSPTPRMPPRATAAPTAALPATAAPSPTPTPTATPAPIRFAIIGDYGRADASAARVAALVAGWAPNFIITTGDNSYRSAGIDDTVGQFYAPYIGNYRGAYGAGSAANRFFPTVGNHDYTDGGGMDAYRRYFTLPPGPAGDERYYDFVRGPVHFFALDSNPAGMGGRAPGDGTRPDSPQGQWLQARLAESSSPWKIVYFHHAPYSSSNYGGLAESKTMRWPFAAWGASAVLGGHDHTYERFQIDEMPAFVNGVGARPAPNRKCYLNGEAQGVPPSEFCLDGVEGAMLASADSCKLTFAFYTHDGRLRDSVTLGKC